MPSIYGSLMMSLTIMMSMMISLQADLTHGALTDSTTTSVLPLVQKAVRASFEVVREEFFDTGISIVLNDFINNYQSQQNYTIPLPTVKQMREDGFALTNVLQSKNVWKDILTPSSVEQVVRNQLNLTTQASGGRQIFDDLEHYEKAWATQNWQKMSEGLFYMILYDSFKPSYRQVQQSPDDYTQNILANTLYKLYVAVAIMTNMTVLTVPKVVSVNDPYIIIGLSAILDTIFGDSSEARRRLNDEGPAADRRWLSSIHELHELHHSDHPGFKMMNMFRDIAGEETGDGSEDDSENEGETDQSDLSDNLSDDFTQVAAGDGDEGEGDGEVNPKLGQSGSEWIKYVGRQNTYTLIQRLWDLDLKNSTNLREALWGESLVDVEIEYNFLPAMRALALGNMLLSLPQNQTTDQPSGDYLILNSDSWSPKGLWKTMKASDWIGLIQSTTLGADVLNSLDVLKNQLDKLLKNHSQMQQTRKGSQEAAGDNVPSVSLTDGSHSSSGDGDDTSDRSMLKRREPDSEDCLKSIDAFLQCEMDGLMPGDISHRELGLQSYDWSSACTNCFNDFASVMRCWACQILATRARESGITSTSTRSTRSARSTRSTSHSSRSASRTGRSTRSHTTKSHTTRSRTTRSHTTHLTTTTTEDPDSCSVSNMINNTVQPLIDSIEFSGTLTTQQTKELNTALFNLLMCDLTAMCAEVPDELPELTSMFTVSNLPAVLSWIADFNELDLPTQFKLTENYWRLKIIQVKNLIDGCSTSDSVELQMNGWAAGAQFTTAPPSEQYTFLTAQSTTLDYFSTDAVMISANSDATDASDSLENDPEGIASALITLAKNRQTDTGMSDEQIFETGAYWLSGFSDGVTHNLLERLDSSFLSTDEARDALNEVTKDLQSLHEGRLSIQDSIGTKGIVNAASYETDDSERSDEVDNMTLNFIIQWLELQIERVAMNGGDSDLQDLLMKIKSCEESLALIADELDVNFSENLKAIADREWGERSAGLEKKIRKFLPAKKINNVRRRLLLDIWGDASKEATAFTAAATTSTEASSVANEMSGFLAEDISKLPYTMIYWYWESLNSNCQKSLESYELPSGIEVPAEEIEEAKSQLMNDQAILCSGSSESFDLIFSRILKPVLELTSLNKSLIQDPNCIRAIAKILQKSISILISIKPEGIQSLQDAMDSQDSVGVVHWLNDYQKIVVIPDELNNLSSYLFVDETVSSGPTSEATEGQGERSSGGGSEAEIVGGAKTFGEGDDMSSTQTTLSTEASHLPSTEAYLLSTDSSVQHIIDEVSRFTDERIFKHDDKEKDLITLNWYWAEYTNNCTLEVNDLPIPKGSEAEPSQVNEMRTSLTSELKNLCSQNDSSKSLFNDRILKPLLRLTSANQKDVISAAASDGSEDKTIIPMMMMGESTQITSPQISSRRVSSSMIPKEQAEQYLTIHWLSNILKNEFVTSDACFTANSTEYESTSSEFHENLQDTLKKDFMKYQMARNDLIDLLIDKSIKPLAAILLKESASSTLMNELIGVARLSAYKLASENQSLESAENALQEEGGSISDWLSSVNWSLVEVLNHLPEGAAVWDQDQLREILSFIHAQKIGNEEITGTALELLGQSQDLTSATEQRVMRTSSGSEKLLSSSKSWLEKYYALLIGKFHWDVLTGNSAAPMMSQVTLEVLNSVERREQQQFSVELLGEFSKEEINQYIKKVNDEISKVQIKGEARGYDKARLTREIRDSMLATTIADAFSSGHPELLKITAKRFHNNLINLIIDQPDSAISAITSIHECEDILTWNNVTVPGLPCDTSDTSSDTERKALWNLQIKPSLNHVKSLLEEGNSSKATIFADNYVTSQQVLPLPTQVWGIVRKGLLDFVQLNDVYVLSEPGTGDEEETARLAAETINQFSQTKDYIIHWLDPSARNAAAHWLNTRVYSGLTSDELKAISNRVVSNDGKADQSLMVNTFREDDQQQQQQQQQHTRRKLSALSIGGHACQNCEPYRHGRNDTGDSFTYSRVFSIAGLGVPFNSGLLLEENEGFGWPQSTIQGAVYPDQIGEPWCLGISSLNWEWVNGTDDGSSNPLYISDLQPADAAMKADPYLPLALISALELIKTQDSKTLTLIIPGLQPALHEDSSHQLSTPSSRAGRKCRNTSEIASKKDLRNAVSQVREKLSYILIYTGYATYDEPEQFWLDLFSDLGLYLRVISKQNSTDNTTLKDSWFDMEGSELAKAPVGYNWKYQGE